MSNAGNDACYVGVAEAASLLGKSDRTVRRWVSSGKLPSKREGARLLVDVSGVLPAEQRQAPDVSSQSVTIASLRAEVDKLTALVGQLTERNDELVRQSDKLWRQIEFLNSTVAALTQVTQRQALEAPKRRSWWPFGKRDED